MKKNQEFEFNEQMVRAFKEVSDYECMFPAYRTNYINSVNIYIEKALHGKKLKFELENNVMKISTTENTRDPFSFINGCEMLDLISRGFTVEDAIKIFEDEISSDIISINELCSQNVMENRKKRFENPKVIKALELISKTKILVLKKTIGILGNFEGVEMIRNTVQNCFKKNIHPAYEIRELMIKQKLSNDDIEGDWERFIPKIQKTHQK